MSRSITSSSPDRAAASNNGGLVDPLGLAMEGGSVRATGDGLWTLKGTSTMASGEGLATRVTLHAHGRVISYAATFPLPLAIFFGSATLVMATTSHT